MQVNGNSKWQKIKGCSVNTKTLQAQNESFDINSGISTFYFCKQYRQKLLFIFIITKVAKFCSGYCVGLP